MTAGINKYNSVRAGEASYYGMNNSTDKQRLHQCFNNEMTSERGKGFSKDIPKMSDRQIGRELLVLNLVFQNKADPNHTELSINLQRLRDRRLMDAYPKQIIEQTFLKRATALSRSRPSHKSDELLD